MHINNIPQGSVLGINYSGMHDSAIVLVAPGGEPLYAASLERFSRAKQDGRPPYALLDGMPWDRIAKIAVSTDARFVMPANGKSVLLPTELPHVRADGLHHAKAFQDFLSKLPGEKEFVCHQMAHASSVYWGSGFSESLCLTYDGGMSNSPWFGGLYAASTERGIEALDQFSALHYAKVTSLYTFVTALLGFTPNKHEGKITGLAAYGKPGAASRALLTKWFEVDFLDIETVLAWVFTYSATRPPMMLVSDAKMARFRKESAAFSREDLAATVQEFAELHVTGILEKAQQQGWRSDNMCLAGGLFANVKINQRVVESGFANLYVAPPMTDDGTALGAAWQVMSKQPGFAPGVQRSMYLGPATPDSEVASTLAGEKIKFDRLADPAASVARLLADGAVVAVFQGRMEFGPRALGNRSILAQASRSDINQSLNERLNRTEFMPFAPMTREEDAEACYLQIERVRHAAQFMTVTVDCTPEMQQTCPAVVHVDGTARPQLVSADSNPLIHAVLTHYKTLTGKMALVNTSFNIHEEPIVCSVTDALRGFFESGLDYLYLNGGFLVSFSDNHEIAVRYLQEKLRQPNLKAESLTAIIAMQSEKALIRARQLGEKERQIQEKEVFIKEQASHIVEQVQVAEEQARAIATLKNALNRQRVLMDAILRTAPVLRPLVNLVRRIRSIVRPRIGHLSQYVPRQLTKTKLPSSAASRIDLPTLSIVTPSYQQGDFLERTLKSVLDQNYPHLEYFVQDGGSSDRTVAVLREYEARLAGWESERDSGQSNAINLGFAKTSGEIMGWLNSDDLLLPGALAYVCEYFARHPDVDVVYGNRLMIDENDMEIGRWILPCHDAEVLSWADYVPQETMFWRRSIWEKSGGAIDESFAFAMDWDLLVRLRDAGARFAHLPVFLGAFRIHSSQKTSANITQVGFREMGRIRERTLGRQPHCKEIRRALYPFLLKHVAVDMMYRLRTRFGKKNA